MSRRVCHLPRRHALVALETFKSVLSTLRSPQSTCSSRIFRQELHVAYGVAESKLLEVGVINKL